MRVTLAYPYDGHGPDATINVDEPIGRRLIRDGLARHPEDLDGMTLPELRDYAERNGIDLEDVTKKTDVRAAIDAAQTASLTPVTVVEPTAE